MAIKGVDIASHQGPNFAYPAGIDFAIIKASGGHQYRNEYLAQQVAGARAAGLELGLYHYLFEPTSGGGDPHLEAANFVAAARPYLAIGVVPWLDVEEFPARVGYAGDLGDCIVAWCDDVERATGCVPGIYTGSWYLNETGLARDARLARYPLWFASWQDSEPAVGFLAPWDRLTVWQYDATGVDKDLFKGDRAAWRALGVPAPAPLAQADPIVASTAIGPDGVPETTIRWGGQAIGVLGTDFVDVGVRVRNAAGDVYHRSIQNGVGNPYIKE